MLAYVFWHWPQPSVDGGSYKNHLLSFHRTLASNKPNGFQHSVVFTIKHAPWLETKEAYEEWYLLDDSAAMDRLNQAAVSGPCEEPHNRVARQAAGGTAGLYLLRHGLPDLNNSRFAIWFAKPAGVSYVDFYSSLQRFTSAEGTGLWGRQMVLGPTQEFCLHSPDQINLPPNFAGHTIPLEPIWPSE